MKPVFIVATEIYNSLKEKHKKNCIPCDISKDDTLLCPSQEEANEVIEVYLKNLTTVKDKQLAMKLTKQDPKFKDWFSSEIALPNLNKI